MAIFRFLLLPLLALHVSGLPLPLVRSKNTTPKPRASEGAAEVSPVPPLHVLMYSWNDEWDRRPPDRFRSCSADQLLCQTTWNATLLSAASALLLHGPDHPHGVVPSELTADPQQRPLYYFTDEAPAWYTAQPFLSQFDLISTYDLLSDAPRPHILGPDLLHNLQRRGAHMLEERAREALLGNLTAKLSLIRSRRTAPVAWFVSNCGAERSYYVAELIKHLPVDIYSAPKARCLGTNLTSLPDRTHPNATAIEDALLASSYLFYLSLENHNCRDYVTEKLYRALDVGVVPIVDGPRDYSAFLPTAHSALRLDDFEPAALAARVSHLLRHLDQYAQLLDFTDLTPEFVQANDHNFDGRLPGDTARSSSLPQSRLRAHRISPSPLPRSRSVRLVSAVRARIQG